MNKDQVPEWDWDISSRESSVQVDPNNYISRLTALDPTDEIKRAYETTLARLTFAKMNSLAPVTDLTNLRIASPLPDGLKASTDLTCMSIRGEYLIEPEEHPAVNQNLKLEADFNIAHSPNELADWLKSDASAEYKVNTEEFSTVIDALTAVHDKYRDTLVIPSKARTTARQSQYHSPGEIFRLLEGLVTVFLPAYENTGWSSAAEVFAQKYGRRCASDESDTVKNDEKYRGDYEVSYKGSKYFCGMHIKIGYRTRINFLVIKDMGINKILIARAGKHGKNTMA